ncbi:MAG: hypothetical protein ACYS9X_33035 [Planctomycetota bacterium]
MPRLERSPARRMVPHAWPRPTDTSTLRGRRLTLPIATVPSWQLRQSLDLPLGWRGTPLSVELA